MIKEGTEEGSSESKRETNAGNLFVADCRPIHREITIHARVLTFMRCSIGNDIGMIGSGLPDDQFSAAVFE